MLLFKRCWLRQPSNNSQFTPSQKFWLRQCNKDIQYVRITLYHTPGWPLLHSSGSFGSKSSFTCSWRRTSNLLTPMKTIITWTSLPNEKMYGTIKAIAYVHPYPNICEVLQDYFEEDVSCMILASANETFKWDPCFKTVQMHAYNTREVPIFGNIQESLNNHF